MSKVINTEGYKPGSIYRVALENFVTYRQVELFPGRSLNLIIGPNGTGKSTFVCAIVLGLCGKTSVIGRAKKISEYVRSGCQQASIEIELYREAGKRNVIITRTFNLECASTWSIDHKSVREKQVQELITGMNIEVDNLCQMLPQDRVQDFSKMDPQQLLRSTLSAVGGQESVSQLDELIETRQKQRNIGTKLTSNTQLLQEQIRLNERLKLQIDAMQQRKEIEQKIELCEKKKLWLEYQDLREKVIEYTNDKKEGVKLVNSHKSKVEPLEKVMEMAKRSISQLEQQKLAASRETLKIKDKVKETLESIKTQQYRIKEIESSLQEKIERHRNRQREIDEAKVKLDKLVTDKNKLVETVGDETKVKLDLDELKNPLRNTNLAIDRLKKNKGEVQYDLETNVSPQIRLYQNKIRQLQDVGEKRLAVLRESSEDAYKAVTWLRQNRDMFEDEVYEPMVLEINFTDQKFARYLENTVANRDLLAFTFTNSRDMNLFMRTVRSELKLKRVNAVCSSQGGTMQPPKSIDQLSYLGFYTYLVDTITAPDPILRYLCKQYNIHRIPIGNEHTYNNSGKVPPNITYFFTENHRFVVRVSSYSGVKSSSTIEIQPAKLMTNSMDVEKLNSFNTQLARFEQTATEHAAKLKEFDKKIALLEQDYNAFVLKRKKIMDGVEKVKTITTQIRLQQSSIRGLQSEPALDIEDERGRAARKHKDSVQKQCRLHGELKDLVAKLHRADVSMFQMKLELSRNAIVQQESELRELKHELRNTQVNNISIPSTDRKTCTTSQSLPSRTLGAKYVASKNDNNIGVLPTIKTLIMFPATSEIHVMR
ncbi:unnamed protein product [Plutella xylostella]|uniref:Structural maintenance of chromosomes protein 5 n=1 Tax=Plutella xylostella TaxID=51655 RepID=A0A8S4F1Q5_PLUXY|nr:unnamed protein product [Plutella xylostella]